MFLAIPLIAAGVAGIDELRRSGGEPRLNSLRPVTPDG
jgi:hypothetical protein